jgi:hypothetical protein
MRSNPIPKCIKMSDVVRVSGLDRLIKVVQLIMTIVYYHYL